MLFISGISLAVTVLLAWSVYTYSYNKLYNNFLSNKLSLVRTIARSIDGDLHKEMNSSHDIQKPEYKRVQKYLHGLKSGDPAITYLYTLNHSPDSNQFFYCFDGDVAENNIFWIESDQFAIEIHTNPTTGSFIQNRQKRYDKGITLKHNQVSFTVSLEVSIRQSMSFSIKRTLPRYQNPEHFRLTLAIPLLIPTIGIWKPLWLSGKILSMFICLCR